MNRSDRQQGARYALRIVMWVLSEWNWALDWAPDLEYALWTAVIDGGPIKDYPLVGDAEVLALRLLALEAGGWFWMPSGENDDEQFLEADDWQERYVSWLRGQASEAGTAMRKSRITSDFRES